MYEQVSSRNACKRNLHEHSLAAHIKPVQRNMSATKSEGPTGGNQPSWTYPQAAESNSYGRWQAGLTGSHTVGIDLQPADGSRPVAGTRPEQAEWRMSGTYQDVRGGHELRDA